MASPDNNSAAPKAKLRWFQYRLSTLFLLMTAIAVFLGIWTDRVRKQQRAVEAIVERGGSIRYSYETNPGTGQPPPPGPAWLRNLLGIDYLDYVAEAYLTGDSFTDADLEHLHSLPNLETLIIGSSNVTDSGLKNLKYLRNLKTLQLGGEKITDAGLAHLQPLCELTDLTLDCSITDADMEQLTPLSKLSMLKCRGWPITKVKMQIFDSLSSPAQMEFFQTPLPLIYQYLSDFHRIKFQIDKAALNDANIDADIPVTYTTKGVPLGIALRSMLEPLGMDWLVGQDALVINTRDIVAKKHPGVDKLKKALPNLKQVYVNW